MEPTGQVWDEIYQDYLNQLAGVDLAARAEALGGRMADGAVELDMFGQTYSVGPDGVTDARGNRPAHALSVILCKYLLMNGQGRPGDDQWRAYKEFKDALPYVEGFDNTAQRPIAKAFGDDAAALEKAAAALGGRHSDEGLSYDLVMAFDALPKVPMLMLFNAAEDMFPPQCSLLFRGDAMRWLDSECVAICGMVLALHLKRAAGKEAA